jgi:hypothetical protein
MAPLQNSTGHSATVPTAPIAAAGSIQTTPVVADIHKEDADATESSEEDDAMDNDIMSGGEPDDAEEFSPDAYLRSLGTYKAPVKTGLKGINVIHDPLYNKGTGFPRVERDRLGKSAT